MALGAKRRVAAAGIVLVAVVAGASVGRVLYRARTAIFLETGSTWWMPGERDPGIPGEHDPSVVAEYTHGDKYEFGFAVRNAGSRSVRVQSVPLPSPGLIRYSEIRMGPGLGESNHGGLDYSKARRFRPFTLRPGDERVLFFVGRFTFCSHVAKGGSR